MSEPNTAPRIEALQRTDIEELRQLAHAVWHRHYPGIISTRQIDYMLAQRYAPQVIGQELNMAGIWWRKAVLGARMVGFSSCVLTERSDELKLDKIYVHHDAQRSGIGGRLIMHAAGLAQELGKTWLILAVNKNNTQAIAAYEKYGFAICESVVKEIGEGFVMDDFIMVKHIEKAPTQANQQASGDKPKRGILSKLGFKRQR